MTDSDIQIREGGVETVNNELYLHDHTNTYIIAKAMFRNQNYNTDPEIRLMPGLKINIFLALRASIWSKNKGGSGLPTLSS